MLSFRSSWVIGGSLRATAAANRISISNTLAAQGKDEPDEEQQAQEDATGEGELGALPLEMFYDECLG
jgi:hypothetical protein